MDFAQGRNLPLVIGGTLVLIIIAAAAYCFFAPRQQNSAVPESEPVSAATTTSDTTVDVSAEVGGAAQTPADKLPETNPFSDYKNPFE